MPIHSEYQDSDESESDFGSFEDEKVKIKTKREKNLDAFRAATRTAYNHWKNREYLTLQQKDLKALNELVIKFKWTDKTRMMPKFWVKHMSIIKKELAEIDPASEQNALEQKALKALKKGKLREIRFHKGQIDIYDKQPVIWANGDSDLGVSENEISDDEESDDKLWELQSNDGDGGDDEAKKDGDEAKTDGDDGSGGDEEEESEVDWEDEDDSGWNTRSEDEEEPEEEEEDSSEYSDDDEGGDEEKEKEKMFGIQAFTEWELKEMMNRSFWLKKKAKVPSQKEKDKEKEERQKAKERKKEKEREKKRKEKEAAQAIKEEAAAQGKVSWSTSKIKDMFKWVLMEKGKSGVNREDVVERLLQLKDQCGIHKVCCGTIGRERERERVCTFWMNFLNCFLCKF